jgi:hypothetical protein
MWNIKVSLLPSRSKYLGINYATSYYIIRTVLTECDPCSSAGLSAVLHHSYWQSSLVQLAGRRWHRHPPTQQSKLQHLLPDGTGRQTGITISGCNLAKFVSLFQL